MKEDTSIRSADIDLGYFDLNTVEEKTISDIPGIGPEVARNIVEHRPYEAIEQLKDVPGVTQDHIDELLRAGAMVGQPVAAGQGPAEDIDF